MFSYMIFIRDNPMILATELLQLTVIVKRFDIGIEVDDPVLR